MSDRFPFPELAYEFLNNKQIVETESWDDLKWGEHSHAFTVAHSRNAGVLDSIFGILTEGMESGESFQTWKKKMLYIMEEKGWYGRKDKGKDDKDYINWRIRLIYDTNMRTAYSAGQYRQQLRGAALRPIWIYKSKLSGSNRREEHKALHNKAFRYDDPFWDSYRPPNGWGCECFVVTMSEEQARQAGIEILSTGSDGSLPEVTDSDGNLINWNTFAAEEWQYNPGLEAFAPNFGAYENLAKYKFPDGSSVLDQVISEYHSSMNLTRMTEGEFITLMNVAGKDEVQKYILYQVGNLKTEQYNSLQQVEVQDSKIMTTLETIANSSLSKEFFPLLYKTFQAPEHIYENTNSSGKGREFLLTSKTEAGKVMEVTVLRKQENTALRVISTKITDKHTPGGSYKQIY